MADAKEKKVSELSLAEIAEILKTVPEVGVELSARWLGLTERMVTNYCRSDQLDAQKVGSKWFIKSASVLKMRGLDQRLEEAVIPELENPLSRAQEERKKDSSKSGSWTFKKGPKRSPRKLQCFSRLEECCKLLKAIEADIHADDFKFFHEELLALGDDLGAGYYSYGPAKRQLYGRARLRAGRMVSRALLRSQPQGLIVTLSHLVEGISFLCRRMDKVPHAA